MNTVRMFLRLCALTFLIIPALPSYSAICVNINDGQIGKTRNVSEPRSLRPISLNNHRCRDIANGSWTQRFEQQQRTDVDLSVEASSVFKGADLGFSGSISDEESKTKTIELSLPQILPACTLWGRQFHDEYRVKTYRYHVRQYSIWGAYDFYSGTLKHCAFRRSGTPATFIATVKEHLLVSYVDKPEPTKSNKTEECRRCGDTGTAATDRKIDESDDDSDTNDPGNTRQIGYRLDDLGKKAFRLGTEEAYAVVMPVGYAMAETSNSILTPEGQITYNAGIYTLVNEEIGEKQIFQYKPFALMDGTVFSRRGLIMFNNGGILKFSNSRYEDENRSEQQ